MDGCIHEYSPSLPPSLPSLQHMKVADNVYAAGDIAQFPLPLTGDKVSIGHWQIAHNHGHVAAMNMLEKRVSFNSVPFIYHCPWPPLLW